MSLPNATDVRDFLEGYGITSDILSDSWIDNRINNSIIPFVEKSIGRTVEGTDTVTEYLSGNGTSILMLSRKNITSLTSIEYVTGSDEDLDATISLDSVRLIEDQGILKSVANVTEGGVGTIFHKGNRNIKVVYTVGNATIEDDIKDACLMLCAEMCLGFVGARTGGGALSVQGFSRNFGMRGKYQDIRNDLKRLAFAILSRHMSSVVGGVK